jgi:hypothetical protein
MKKNLLQISNIIFKDRSKWSEITDEEKGDFFFIFNRYFSKRYPEFAQLVNIIGTNPVIGMDLWFNFMKGKAYPQWFWSKSAQSEKSEKTWDKLGLREDEFRIIEKFYPEELESELKWLKELQKNKK